MAQPPTECGGRESGDAVCRSCPCAVARWRHNDRHGRNGRELHGSLAAPGVGGQGKRAKGEHSWALVRERMRLPDGWSAHAADTAHGGEEERGM